MKKNLFILALVLFSISSFGQNSGLGFNYQAVVRGVDGFVLSEQSVELQFSLMPGQQATQASWIEIHNVTTDEFGTIGVVVGKGIKAGGVAAAFADVNFAAIHYWLKIEIKENGNFRELSYSQLTSVPYAEVANNAVNSPIGSIMPFAGDASKVPTGWLLCDGDEVSRSEYAALYDVIGTAWGFGNNSTTFNLPDMRGVFLRGISGDSEKDEDVEERVPLKEGGNSGNNVGSYQGDAIRNITGKESDQNQWCDNFRNNVEGAFSYHEAGYNAGDPRGGGGSDPFYYLCFDASLVVPVGSDNRPQNVYVNYIIKF